MADDGATELRSIGNRRGTAMALHTLRGSGGIAVCRDDEQVWSC
ncbi:MAG: hypothetical protein ACRDRK_07440 [Pseudonocardia sp.]